MSVKNPYTPLWCKSYYSFLEGASSPEQYVSEAAKLGLKSFAITDRDGIYGVVKAYEAALEHDIHLIIGSEITVKDPDLPTFSILFLVQNQQGYSNLCRLITLGRRRCEKGSSEVTFKECLHACRRIVWDMAAPRHQHSRRTKSRPYFWCNEIGFQ